MAQDTLLKLWTIREELDKYQSPQALAMVILNRLALNYIRQSKHISNADIESFGDEFIDASYETAEIVNTVNDMLGRLPESQQQILRMRHLDGLEIEQMAQILQTSNGAIRTALSRARHAAAALFKVSPLK